MVTQKYFENGNKSIMLTTNFFEKKRDLFFKIKSKCYVLVNIFKNKFNKNENKLIFIKIDIYIGYYIINYNNDERSNYL